MGYEWTPCGQAWAGGLLRQVLATKLTQCQSCSHKSEGEQGGLRRMRRLLLVLYLGAAQLKAKEASQAKSLCLHHSSSASSDAD